MSTESEASTITPVLELPDTVSELDELYRIAAKEKSPQLCWLITYKVQILIRDTGLPADEHFLWEERRRLSLAALSPEDRDMLHAR